MISGGTLFSFILNRSLGNTSRGKYCMFDVPQLTEERVRRGIEIDGVGYRPDEGCGNSWQSGWFTLLCGFPGWV